MFVKVSRASLLTALGTAVNVVERRHTLPILGHVLVQIVDGVCTLRTTDLELQIETQCSVMEGSGSGITIPARKFHDICRSFSDDADISVKVDGERAVIQAGRSRFVLGTLPAGDFPAMELGDVMLAAEVDGTVLRTLLDKTAFAMAQQDVRYYLNGVSVEFTDREIIAVATDGHRLAKCSGSATSTRTDGVGVVQVILPAKSVTELRRLLGSHVGTLQVQLGERAARFSVGSTILTTKLVEGRYPEYERVIPRNLERYAVVPRELLRSALQRTAILSSEKYKGVRVTFEAGNIALAVQNQEKEEAEDALAIEYAGESTVIGFNLGYILDVLGAVDQGDVEVFFRDGESSSIWRGKSCEAEVFVIMPMRL